VPDLKRGSPPAILPGGGGVQVLRGQVPRRQATARQADVVAGKILLHGSTVPETRPRSDPDRPARKSAQATEPVRDVGKGKRGLATSIGEGKKRPRREGAPALLPQEG